MLHGVQGCYVVSHCVTRCYKVKGCYMVLQEVTQIEIHTLPGPFVVPDASTIVFHQIQD